jgi:hypothetical protein
VPARVRLPILAAFLAVSAALLAPALRGTPVSDDVIFLESPYLRELSAGNLLALLDPTDEAALSLHNYAPVHALLQAATLSLFGEHWLGHHLLNVALHAVTAWLLVLLFARSGLAPLVAVGAATLFLVHPANVEAVAWISQLKTTAAAALAVGALQARPERPRLALLLFGLALLTKSHAAFALPVATVFTWSEGRGAWRWIAGWALVFAAFAIVELPTFRAVGEFVSPALQADGWLHLRFVVAIAARYLAMAAAGHGLSAFHEPPLPVSWLDPWWLGGVAALLALGVRLVVCLRERRAEAAFWVWAAAAFAPVSQVFPFLHGMGDRYLYFALPGLLGGVFLASQSAAAHLVLPARRCMASQVALGAVAGLAVLFAVRSAERARIWRHEDAVVIDAALHYPDGIYGHLLRAREAARSGDAKASVASLRAAHAQGWAWIGFLFQHPAYAPIRENPEFQAAVQEMAGDLIATLDARRRLSQMELQTLAQAHIWRGERAEAERVLERALAQGGPVDASVREALGQLRSLRARTAPDGG